MRKIILFDSEGAHADLLPLSFTRPLCHMRVGITTLREKWQALLPGEYHVLPIEYLRPRFDAVDPTLLGDDTLWILGSTVADAETAAAFEALAPGEAVTDGDETIAFVGPYADLLDRRFTAERTAPVRRVRYLFDIFLLNPGLICEDFRRITAGRRSMPIPDSCRVTGPLADSDGLPQVFIEEGAQLDCATLSTKEGPVYIGRDAVVMEGVCMRGPIALCSNAQARMGARLYAGSTFGPYCKVGGEVSNTVMFGYSNKSHDGYLGNAVIGEWCNLGAGVNSSNLKNDYSKIRLWNYRSRTFMRTDLQFCGLMMGDHSKAGINFMFNTATVVGVGVNVYGAGFPRQFIPSFTEGSPTAGFKSVPVSKFETVAARVMGRRGIEVTDADRRIFERIYEVASQFKQG